MGVRCFFLIGKRSNKIFLLVVAYLIHFACEMTFAWSSGVFDHCSLSMGTSWRGPAEIFALRDHGPLFSRVVVDVVTVSVGFSIPFAHYGIVPRLLGDRAGRWSFLLGFGYK